MTHKKRSRTKTKSKASKKRGQKAIESERAEQIQKALIREHYMEGNLPGNGTTRLRLRSGVIRPIRMAVEVGADSRALIKLGLGPSHDHLLNPESAMTMAPSTADQKANKQGIVDPQKTPATNPVGQSGVPQQ